MKQCYKNIQAVEAMGVAKTAKFWAKWRSKIQNLQFKGQFVSWNTVNP